MIDRDLKEIPSTKGVNFSHLIQRYTYRKDKLPEAMLQTKHSLEILCRLNQRVCKKIGLEEIASNWKSLAILGQMMLEAKQKIESIKHPAPV